MTDTEIEKHYFTWDEHGTSYRLRPNPDTCCGFEGGAYFGWKSEKQDAVMYDKTEFYLAPDALKNIASMLLEAVKDMKADEEL